MVVCVAILYIFASSVLGYTASQFAVVQFVWMQALWKHTEMYVKDLGLEDASLPVWFFYEFFCFKIRFK